MKTYRQRLAASQTKYRQLVHELQERKGLSAKDAVAVAQQAQRAGFKIPVDKLLEIMRVSV